MDDKKKNNFRIRSKDHPEKNWRGFLEPEAADKIR